MKCPNCDAEMYEDDDVPDVWICPECEFVEDRT